MQSLKTVGQCLNEQKELTDPDVQKDGPTLIIENFDFKNLLGWWLGWW